MISNMQFRHIIIPMFATPAINSLPKLNPLGWIQRSLAVAVITIALSHGTTMIDRALAEDLAVAFEVGIDEIPTDINEVVKFIRAYMAKHLEHESSTELIFRLHAVSQRLQAMIINMSESPDLYGQ